MRILRIPGPAAAASFSLVILMTTATQAAPTPYRFVSVYSENVVIGALAPLSGSINNHGVMAVGLGTPQVVYAVNVPVWIPVWEADSSFQGFSDLDINDIGQFGGRLGVTISVSALVRIEADGTLVTLADQVAGCPGANDFCSFGIPGDALNNAGQMAITASFDHGDGPVNGVWLFDDDGPIEIAREDFVSPGSLFHFSVPSINDAGVVAFGATEVDDIDGQDIYTSTGGPPNHEGTPPYPFGGGINNVIIDNGGSFGVGAGSGVYTFDGANFTTVLTPQFTGTDLGNISFNDLGRLAFLGCIGSACGIFTGSDAVDDVVLTAGDPLFGGTVTVGSLPTGAFRFTQNGLNDDGDIVFKVQIDVEDSIESHLVRAIALLAEFDSDDDGVGNDVDNCLTLGNPDQRDTDTDGYGNRCDADLNNDGIANFGDLAILKSVFLSGDPDADLDGSGTVAFGDLAIIKSMFLKQAGPSALTE